MAKLKCSYPECEAEATCTGTFRDDDGEGIGDVPLCLEHYKYVQDPENQLEVLDLYGTPVAFFTGIKPGLEKSWNEEV